LKNFSECTERSKKFKVLSLTKSHTSPELRYALSTKYQNSGKICAASLLNQFTTTPTRDKKIKSVLKEKNCERLPVAYTPDEALAFLIENGLTKQQYINIRLGAIQKNCKIYPSYENVIEAKKRCYPDNLHVTETSCKIPMQDLLNHTTKRICSLPQVKLENEMTNLEMLYKWGCDGSSGQLMYRMKFNDLTTDNDSTVFIFSLVPLLLRCSISDENVVLWKNVRPSSHFFRPIKFLYEKETIESTKREVNAIESELKNIFPTDILLEDNNLLKIKHTLIFSMVDGKVTILHRYKINLDF
jgi:hypothetical protein